MFEKEYREITKSRFHLDYTYHNTLLKHSEKNSVRERDNAITDVELFEASACSIEAIRRFVVDNNVKFYTGYDEAVIRKIEIDRKDLKEKIKNYTPDNPYIEIQPVAILKLLNEKQEEYNRKESLLQQKKEDAGIEEGDYIYIQKNEWGKEVKEFGLVKEIKLDYTHTLSIQYNKLKTDLSESRLPFQNAKAADIFSFIKADIFLSETKQAKFRAQAQVIKLFIDKGKRNPAFYKKNKAK